MKKTGGQKSRDTLPLSRLELSADPLRLPCYRLVWLPVCRYHTDKAFPCLSSLLVFATCLRLVRDDRRNIAVRRGRQVDRIILSPDGEARAALDLRVVLRLAKAA